MEIDTDEIMTELPEDFDTNQTSMDVGIAVDVGTSTVAVSVWSLTKRKCLLTVSERNCQIRYGHDVIRRIAFAIRPPLTGSSQVVESGPSALHYSIITQVESLIDNSVKKLITENDCEVHVRKIVITGNTTMLSFVCALPVDGLAAAPFNPASLFGFTARWDDVRKGTVNDKCVSLDPPTADILQVFSGSLLDDDIPVYFPPCVGSFIGADAVCAMLSAGFPVPSARKGSSLSWEAPVKAPLLLVDFGTNTELALYIPGKNGEAGKILCTNAAAGPALEGANISCGYCSIDGAVDGIEYKGNLKCHVIGGGKAKGICGSGLVSAVAELYKNKFIDDDGVIQKAVSKLGDGSICIQLTPAVYISQQDIRNVQLAKSAVFTGISYMIERTSSLPVLCIAGSQGAHFDITEACSIGLIPKELESRCVHLGNAALAGASALLFSKALREKATAIARNAYQLNLAAVPGFQQTYLNSIGFSRN